ncbi:MAG: BspA family leucine-rich repeat surface protein, partial [Vagococcus sp.]
AMGCSLLLIGSAAYADSINQDFAGELDAFTEKTTKVEKTERSQSTYYSLPSKELVDVKNLQNDYRSLFDNFPTGKKFQKAPVLNSGTYNLGVFNGDKIDNATNMINFYRKLAGVNPVQYLQETEKFAQHGAIGMASVRNQSHYIDIESEKPKDMPNEFWNIATESARLSNLHSSKYEDSFFNHINAFITDYGNSNRTTGHRSWLLGLAADNIGLGYAQSPGELVTSGSVSNFYIALNVKSSLKALNEYSKDKSINWPSEGVFPFEMYNAGNPYSSNSYGKDYERNMRWSVFLHQHGYTVSLDNIRVYLTDQDTRITTEIQNDNNGGEVSVKNYKVNGGGYYNTAVNTVAFRPNNDYEIKKNTLYTVKITGLEKDGQLVNHEYSTRFVGMYDEYNTAVEKLSVSPKEVELITEQSQQLTATVMPENATNKKVIWSSSNESIAVVNNTGLVTAKKTGKVTISATSEDGKKVGTSKIVIRDSDGRFGTAPWTWDEVTQTVTFYKGAFPNTTATYNNIAEKVENSSTLNGKKIKHINFKEKVVANENISYLFSSLGSLETFENFSNLDTSQSTNMSYLFYNSNQLSSIDLSHFDTRKVTDMTAMFYNGYNLLNLDLGSFNTSNVTSMRFMFYNSNRLTNLDLSHFDTRNVTDMRQMFSYMGSLLNLNLNNFNTSKVIDMRQMFYSVDKLTSLNLTSFDTRNVTNMRQMFTLTNSLLSLDLSHFDMRKTTDRYAMLSTTVAELKLGENTVLVDTVLKEV